MGLCVMHELAQISDNTQQHQLRFRTAFRTTMFVFASSPLDIMPFDSRTRRNRLLPHACVVLEKNR